MVARPCEGRIGVLMALDHLVLVFDPHPAAGRRWEIVQLQIEVPPGEAER